MTFRFINREEIEPGPNCNYREIKVYSGNRPGTYYVELRESKRVLSGEKSKTPEVAYREIRRVPKYRPTRILVNTVTNSRTLTDIAETLEAEERSRRKG